MNRDNQFLIAEAGGIPPLVRLMRYGNEAQKESARYALSNFAYEHPNKRGNKILIPALSARRDIWPKIGMRILSPHSSRSHSSHLAENLAKNVLDALQPNDKKEYRVAIEEAWRCTNIGVNTFHLK